MNSRHTKRETTHYKKRIPIGFGFTKNNRFTKKRNHTHSSHSDWLTLCLKQRDRCDTQM